MTKINPIRDVPSVRVRAENSAPVNTDGEFVLYWMTAFRRTKFNFALQHAANLAMELGKPLIVFEPLQVGYRWASDRLHRFIIDGMASNQSLLESKQVTYLPYVEPQQGDSKGLLLHLSKHSCSIVTDDYPCFFLPSLIRTIRKKISVSLQSVDSNGIIPIRLADRTFTVAHSYRRWMQKNVMDHWHEKPLEDPTNHLFLPELENSDVQRYVAQWQVADLNALRKPNGLTQLPINHEVKPVEAMTGGEIAARARLGNFINTKLSDYDTNRNHPDFDATSHLSPYLHFGHLAAHEFANAILDREDWTENQMGTPNGKNSGFWNVGDSAEGILDQLLTWRELGFNFAARHPRRVDKFNSLPNWAKTSLEEHSVDLRPHLYSLKEFESASTHDPIWNAAQRELVETGIMHNYMRMLWGKKILHWSKTPQEALSVLIHLNNKYALDGRDPNSYSGIMWVLGRYDRAWGPKREVFGSVRYMTSESAQRKLRMKQYLAKHTPRNG